LLLNDLINRRGSRDDSLASIKADRIDLFSQDVKAAEFSFGDPRVRYVQAWIEFQKELILPSARVQINRSEPTFPEEVRKFPLILMLIIASRH
jgi:hypothetical protein